MATSIQKNDLEQLERKIYNLTKLVSINTIINSTLDMGKLLALTMGTIKDIMETEASTLLLYEEESKDLVFKVALGEAGKELTEKYRVKMGQGIAGWVAEARKPLYINDVYKDRRFDPEFDRKTGFHTQAMICSPLLYKGKLLGVIQAINPINRPEFTAEDINLFNIFADQAALAVQNAIFFQNALEEERIQSEIASARAIHESRMQDISIDIGPFAIAAKSTSAREIGGEFHTVLPLKNSQAAIALGDLHEKGIPGGLHASIVSGALRALAAITGGEPHLLIKHLRASLKNDLTSMQNASIFYGICDPASRSIKFLNAGSASPLLVRNGTARYLRFGKQGLQNKINTVKSITVRLHSGDLFVVISHGLKNIKNSRGKALGLKRIMERLQGISTAPENIIESLNNLAKEFAGEIGIREDISIIVVKML